MLLELFHVSSDQHLSEFDKVAVFLVVDLDHTPWVTTTANLATFRGLNLGVSTNDREWDLGHDFVVLGDCLLVIELVTWALKNVDVVVVDIRQDLSLLAQEKNA